MRKLISRIKMLGIPGVFPWVWLTVAFVRQMIFQIRFGKALLGSDLAAEMVLADLLNKEHSILSKNWYYSTELRVFESQWFYRIGLIISPNNWHVARLIATMIMLIIFVLLILMTAKMFGLQKYGPWAAAIMISPFGRMWLICGLYGTYYLIYSYFSLMTVIAVLGLCQSEKLISPKNIGYFILGLFASFASGLNGIKQLILFFSPLLIASFLLLVISLTDSKKEAGAEPEKFIDRKEVKIFGISCIFSCINVVGYLINSRYLHQRYSFSEFGMTTWTSSPQNRMYDLILDFISLFGYEQGDKVLSVKGLLSGVGLLFGFLVIGIIVILTLRVKQLKTEERLLVLICASTLGFCLTIFCFIDLYQNYYWLPLIPFSVLAIMVFIKNTVEKTSLNLKTLSTLVAIAAAFLVFLVSENTLAHEKGNPTVISGFEDATEFLLERGLTQGYATLWSSDVIRELSSGKIETWSISSPDTYVLHKWLQEKDHFERDPQGEVFYIFSSDPRELGDNYVDTKMIQGDNCEEIYSKNNIHIYLYESAESFMNSGIQL